MHFSDLTTIFICAAVKSFNRRFPGLALLLICVLPPLDGVGIFGPSALPLASENHAYLSKDYVDAVVQKAFNSLSEAANAPGADFKRKSAIEDARRVAKKLKAQAAADPNGQYILFRVGELEQQLWLEENDLDLQKKRDVQKAKNTCIDTFNLELGKKRPDFAVLARAVARVESLNDPAKVDEMRRSQGQRTASVSRELSYRFERAFANGDLDTARAEFDYCSKNRTYLAFSNSFFNALSDKIRMQSDAVKKKPALEAELRHGTDYCQRNLLREARTAAATARTAFDQIKGGMSIADRSFLEALQKSLTGAVARKEDSLVAASVALYAAQGEDAALAFIDKVLKKLGVSQNKVAAASDYVLSHGAHVPKNDSLINTQVFALSTEKSGTQMSVDDIRERAKQKAKAKADSVRLAEEHKAEALVLEIYSLLERNKIDESFAAFNANLVLLETYVNKDALSTLSSSVTAAYDQRRDEKAEHSQTIAAVALSPSADDLGKNREKAARHITIIYSMLEQGKTRDAYEHFAKFRDKLKQYLCKEAFDMVETTVAQAYSSVQAQGK